MPRDTFLLITRDWRFFRYSTTKISFHVEAWLFFMGPLFPKQAPKAVIEVASLGRNEVDVMIARPHSSCPAVMTLRFSSRLGTGCWKCPLSWGLANKSRAIGAIIVLVDPLLWAHAFSTSYLRTFPRFLTHCLLWRYDSHIQIIHYHSNGTLEFGYLVQYYLSILLLYVS